MPWSLHVIVRHERRLKFKSNYVALKRLCSYLESSIMTYLKKDRQKNWKIGLQL